MSDGTESELKLWLCENGVNYFRLGRDFADSVRAAKLLKNLFPEYVDLHRYFGCSSFRHKLSNWETLNLKVLERLKLGQSKKQLQHLAMGRRKAVEKLLYTIKNAEVLRQPFPKPVKSTEDQTQFSKDHPELFVVATKCKVGSTLVTKHQQMIAYKTFKEEMDDYTRKLASMGAVKKRVTQLERQLKDKVDYCTKLEAKLESLRKAQYCGALKYKPKPTRAMQYNRRGLFGQKHGIFSLN